MKAVENIPTLFVFNGTPVKVRPGFWIMVAGLWAVLAGLGNWRWPGQSWGAYLLVGGIGALLALLADVGHACAHTVSARLAGAPMDVILLGADMPRTLYWNNDVPPRAHIVRSLGGPVYSAIGLLIGIGWLLLTPPEIPALRADAASVAEVAMRYLGEIWTLANGGIFLALFAPLPLVDGGVILKWALVLGGATEAQADELVRRIGLGLGVGLLAVGVFFLLEAVWLLAGVLILIGLVVLGAALKIIR